MNTIFKKAVYGLLILLLGAVGGYLGLLIVDTNIITWPETLPQLKIGLIVITTMLGVVVGVFTAPKIIKVFIKLKDGTDRKLAKTHASDVLMGAVGLAFGLIIANLLGAILAHMGQIGKTVWFLSTIVLGYLGLVVGVKKREELLNWMYSLPHLGKEKALKTVVKEKEAIKVLDTSVVIDGRIIELCESGFLEGVMLVPSFVVDELRHVADSSDLLKRNRGRRGLDILNHMRINMPDVQVRVYDDVRELENIAEVDAKLIKVAQKLGGKILTNDYNLNKVAELQEIKVLNINELANAVKPVVLPGEEMVVQVVKDGKESGQGLAYLEDGTMIVVDGGKNHIGQTITVLVTSVLQTAAGRMIFAKTKINGRQNESA